MKTCFYCEEVTEDVEELTETVGELACSQCRSDMKCMSCYGTGEYSVCRNEQGQLDYIRGRPTSEKAKCTICQGEGYR